MYLLGAAVIALPIYLHLKRRPPKETVEFSSLMFLEPTRTVHTKRRNQLENLLLLILRSLAVLGLAFMFSRPFFRGDAKPDPDGSKARHVVLVDRSASMQREGLWKEARERAVDALPDSPNASVALMAFDASPNRLFGFEEWNAWPVGQRKERAEAALASLKPGWSRTDPGEAIVQALELLNDADADDSASTGPHRVTLVSDFQKSAALQALRSIDWPAHVVLEPVVVESAEPGNAGMQWVRSAGEGLPDIRVVNASDSSRSSFTLTGAVSVDVPPGESRITRLGGEKETEAVEIRLSGDAHPFDDILYFAPSKHRTLRILYAGKQDASLAQSPFYYIQRAFPETEHFRAEFLSKAEVPPDFAIIPRISVVAQPEEIVGLMEHGLTVLAVLDEASSARLTALSGCEGIEVGPGQERDYTMLARIDFDASALAAFNEPKVRDFTRIRFWKYRRIDPDSLPESARVLAAYDNGDPAWIRFPVGKGALVVLTSGWAPSDSQLARSSKFLPLLYSVFGAGGLAAGTALPGFVGDPVTVADASASSPVVVTHPGGTESEIEAPFQFVPDAPGIYRTAGFSFAANVPPGESETAILPLSEFEAFGIHVSGNTAGLAATANSDEGRARQLDSERESEQRLWQWIVLAVFLMLIVETWLAGRPRRVNNEAEAEPVSP